MYAPKTYFKTKNKKLDIVNITVIRWHEAIDKFHFSQIKSNNPCVLLLATNVKCVNKKTSVCRGDEYQ